MKSIDASRVKMIAAIAADIAHRVIDRPGSLVRPLRRQGIEDIGHGNDAPKEGDRFPRDPVRLAPAIESFMVGDGDGSGRLQHGRIAALQEFVTDQRMPTHDDQFVI